MIVRILAVLALTLCTAATPALPRIVTLVPSLGDDAFAIGANVVGVSAFTGVPKNSHAVKVGDFQSVDAERIIALHPDAVIGIPSQSQMTAPLRAAGVRVVLVTDDSYDNIFSDLREVGRLSSRQAAAQALADRLHRETETLAHKVTWKNRPSVFFALGTGPVWTAGSGSYIERLIALAGGRNAANALHAPWGEFSEEALLRAQPDIIIAGHDTNLQSVLDREPWRSLKAVRSGHVFVVPEGRITDALYRPGPDYNEGLRWLIERLSSLSMSTTHPARSNRN